MTVQAVPCRTSTSPTAGTCVVTRISHAAVGKRMVNDSEAATASSFCSTWRNVTSVGTRKAELVGT